MPKWVIKFIPDQYYESKQYYREEFLPNIGFTFKKSGIKILAKFHLNDATEIKPLVNAIKNKGKYTINVITGDHRSVRINTAKGKTTFIMYANSDIDYGKIEITISNDKCITAFEDASQYIDKFLNIIEKN